MMQVASVSLGLVSMQALLISHSTRSVKLPFFQKAVAVVVIVDFVCIQANAPCPLLCKKGGIFSEAYGTTSSIYGSLGYILGGM